MRGTTFRLQHLAHVQVHRFNVLPGRLITTTIRQHLVWDARLLGSISLLDQAGRACHQSTSARQEHQTRTTRLLLHAFLAQNRDTITLRALKAHANLLASNAMLVQSMMIITQQLCAAHAFILVTMCHRLRLGHARPVRISARLATRIQTTRRRHRAFSVQRQGTITRRKYMGHALIPRMYALLGRQMSMVMRQRHARRAQHRATMCPKLLPARALHWYISARLVRLTMIRAPRRLV